MEVEPSHTATCTPMRVLRDATRAAHDRIEGALPLLDPDVLGVAAGRIGHCRELPGAAFFAGYGERTGTMWKRFGAYVDHAPGLELETATGAANETFDALARWVS